MLILQHVSYRHPDQELLFRDINLTIASRDKAALVGNNGAGKSTLLQIAAGILQPSEGTVAAEVSPYYIPQLTDHEERLTVAEALRIAPRVDALNAILGGDTSEANFNALEDDWTVEERCLEALACWDLYDIDLQRSMASLSGGQRTKVLLAGIVLHQPALVLLDEPSNHLDRAGRALLYQFIRTTTAALLVVSHDRELFSHVTLTCELSSRGITVYGGNYDFYKAQKETEQKALYLDIHSKEKALRQAQEKAREATERQQRLDARGKSKQEKAGVARIMMNTLRNNAERSTAKTKEVHAEKKEGIVQELKELRSALPAIDKMTFGFRDTDLHKGKVLVRAMELNLDYGKGPLWPGGLSFELRSGERIALEGKNGSGKTSLIKMILGELMPSAGSLSPSTGRSVYIDQDYTLIDGALNVYDLAQQYNTGGLEEHEVKSRLNRFLFTARHWHKSCRALSGGERMRLILCCLTLDSKPPDLIVLDEPTNNLDLQNIEILTAAINAYKGTLIVISHDRHFIAGAGVEKTIVLDDDMKEL